jgi:acyl-CoA dehydrogenase
VHEWSEQHWQIRKMMRRFVETELVPRLDDIEHLGVPPYELMRKMFDTFGLGQLALGEYEAKKRRRERAEDAEGAEGAEARPKVPKKQDPEMLAMRAIPILELSRHSPGLVTALGVSVGLTANAILARGRPDQIDRYVPDLLTLKKIGAWAITEPGSGSDAFGSMRSTARKDGDDYVLNGQKTFITNGPYADVIVFICKLDDGSAPEHRPVVQFVLEGETPGLVKSKPLRKMGLHSSPTGELFLDDVRVPASALLDGRTGSARDDAKATFGAERTGVLAMALGMVERALEMSVDYARTRVQFGKPIGERQLIQLKLAKMEVARQNIQNMLFRTFNVMAEGKSMSLAEASACKLYAAQATMEVCLEAVQVFGGNGYMSEYRIEQLARDAKCLQIYGGTDEIQISQIARDLLRD